MAELRDFFKPDLDQRVVPRSSKDPDGVRYLRACLRMRLGVGAMVCCYRSAIAMGVGGASIAHHRAQRHQSLNADR